MKALVYTAPDHIVCEERPRPEPTPGTALVRIRQAGICGTDMAIVHGAHPRAAPPLIPGHEFAGEVVAVNGVGAGAPAPGDKVALFPLLWCGRCKVCRQGSPHVCRDLRLIGIDRDGGFAEYAVIPWEHLVRLPADFDYCCGALLEPLAVGVHAVAMAAAGREDITVVLGAGPIGIMTCHSLRHAGFQQVLIADINPLRLERAAKLGHTTVTTEQLPGKLAEISGGEGADLVFECAGAAPAVQMTVDILRPRGKAVIVSVHKRHPPVDLRGLNFKELVFIGARVYTRDDFDTAVSALRDLDAQSVISHSFPIEDGERALALCAAPQADTCKVMIDMEGRQ